MRSIVLIGTEYSDKASIGRALAEASKRAFVDGDRQFEDKHGSIQKFIEANGWEKFREAEAALIQRICGQSGQEGVVFCPGEEAVAHFQGEEWRANSVRILRDFGMVFYLLRSPQSQAGLQGIAARWIPGFSMDSNLLSQKHNFYLKAAHRTIYTENRSAAEIVADILAAVTDSEAETRKILESIHKRRDRVPAKQGFLVLYQRGHNFLLLKKDGFYARNYHEKGAEQMRKFERSAFAPRYYYGSLFNRIELLDIFSNIEPERLQKHFEDQVR